MKPKPTIVLVDIDGTLLTTAGAGRRAMVAAFADLHGKDPCDFAFGGMTDRAIARQGLVALGARAELDDIDRLVDAYIAHLEAHVAASEVRCCVGIEAAIDAIEAAPFVAMGLGTGNVRPGARIKISRVMPFDRFAFGGFGCDHESRPDLLRIGADRGAERLGHKREDCRVVVIGDTPKDVHAAHAIGAECVAVATGSFTLEALVACAPKHAYKSLAEPGAIDAVLGA